MPDTLPKASDIHADAPASPRDAFGFRLGRLSRWWRGQIDERLRPQGLTQARWIVLVNLRRGGEGMQQKDLARFVGVEGPTLVRVLDYLEGENLIERRADTSDRRKEELELIGHDDQHEEISAPELQHEQARHSHAPPVRLGPTPRGWAQPMVSKAAIMRKAFFCVVYDRQFRLYSGRSTRAPRRRCRREQSRLRRL